LQEGFLPLPKSVTPSRIASNLDCFDIELDTADLEVLKNISGLAGGAPNPDEMDF
jgi:oxidoreductase